MAFKPNPRNLASIRNSRSIRTTPKRHRTLRMLPCPNDTRRIHPKSRRRTKHPRRKLRPQRIRNPLLRSPRRLQPNRTGSSHRLRNQRPKRNRYCLPRTDNQLLRNRRRNIPNPPRRLIHRNIRNLRKNTIQRQRTTRHPHLHNHPKLTNPTEQIASPTFSNTSNSSPQ